MSNKLYELTSLPLRNKGCGYLEKFAQGCEASPVAERKPEALTKGLAESGLPAIRGSSGRGWSPAKGYLGKYYEPELVKGSGVKNMGIGRRGQGPGRVFRLLLRLQQAPVRLGGVRVPVHAELAQ